MPVFQAINILKLSFIYVLLKKNQGTTDKIIVKVDTEKTCRKIWGGQAVGSKPVR